MNYLTNIKEVVLIAIAILSLSYSGVAQEYSAARIWNEMVLNAIRGDFARPTVHARNLYHTSLAMYDAFAVYDDVNETVLLGKSLGGYTCDFEGIPAPADLTAAREMAISYAVFRIVQHRFKESPRSDDIQFNIRLVLSAFGYDQGFTSTDYQSGNPAALGNYIAEQIIAYGLQDGSNEENDYANEFYEPVNPDLNPFLPWYDPVFDFGNPRMNDPNRWQKLDIPNFVGQDGIETDNGVPPFLGPEWGLVTPFALTDDDLTIRNRDGHDWWVYNDPGPPSLVDTLDAMGTTEDYIWGFSMTAHWKSHTISDTNLVWDISPASLGNLTEIPETIEEIRDYYDFIEGGDKSTGHVMNPVTGLPYEPQMVPRSDYARVLAEFWADGPASETPPGHWFTILNYVNDQEQLEKKYKGEGSWLSDLEWDVKSYFALGGAMHDSAISAWSCKGFYDYLRPVSAIRYLADNGQSSDPGLPNYSPLGIMLIPGSIEQILDGDPLLSFDSSNYGNIKMLANVFEDEKYYFNADYWLPYQSPNFVTPPFAGYVSGHSTYSRAAAEVLAAFTGDDFFPGGMGEFHFEKEGSLEFGDPGPSLDMSLQWATYVDAANQSGMSRIWGGIHPPIDDIPGRRIGEKVGKAAFEKADSYFGAPESSSVAVLGTPAELSVYPNPVLQSGMIHVRSETIRGGSHLDIVDANGQFIFQMEINTDEELTLDLSNLDINAGLYNLSIITTDNRVATTKLMIVK